MELMIVDPIVHRAIKFVQHRVLNSQPEVDHSLHDFVVHIPGPNMNVKLPWLQHFARHVLPRGVARQPRAVLLPPP